MGDRTSIEWTDASWNPTEGCAVVSPGCTSCYAMKIAARFSDPGQHYHGLARRTKAGGVWTGVVRVRPDKLGEPLRWRKPRRVFVNSMSDLFHPDVPSDFIDHVFAVMALAPQHVFQILTKRPERMREYIVQDRMGYIEGRAKRLLRERSRDPLKPILVRQTLAGTWPWPNVWLGVSVEDQARADERIPHLLATPAAVRFISCEPQLGQVDFAEWLFCEDCADSPGPYGPGVVEDPVSSAHGGKPWGICWPCRDRAAKLHWIIIGGESGPGARPCDLRWIRSIIAQCLAAGTPAFVKQLGARPYDACPRCHGRGHHHGFGEDGRDPDWCSRCGGPGDEFLELKSRKGGDPSEWPEDLRVREFPEIPR